MSTTASSSLPRALVSLSALRRGADAALSHGGTVADLRADAWGHGTAEVARVMADAGAHSVIVDEVDREAISQDALSVLSAGDGNLDAQLLFGLPEQPAMSLVGRVLSTKKLFVGDAVSYGYTFRVTAPTRVALVTGGYAQGIMRALGNRVSVEIAGRLCPIVGRVAMDVCVVDLGEVDVAEGTDVVFFGGEGPAQGQLADWERATGLSAAELVTAVGLHVTREYVA